MAQKLWEKSVQVNKDIERFTVGRDREMDLYLAKHDVLGSMAHITMLESIGLLTKEELEAIEKRKRIAIIPSLTVKFIKTPLKALFYLGFSAVPFRFTI